MLHEATWIYEHIRKRPCLYLCNNSTPKDANYNLIRLVVETALGSCYHSSCNNIRIHLEPRAVTFEFSSIDAYKWMNLLINEPYVDNEFGMWSNINLYIVNALSKKIVVNVFNEESNMSHEIVIENGTTRDNVPMDIFRNGHIRFKIHPDTSILKNLHFDIELAEPLLKTYTYLKPNLCIELNGKQLRNEAGLEKLLIDYLYNDSLYHYNANYYQIIHLIGKDVEIAFTHGDKSEYFSFVNYYSTKKGGTHLEALKSSINNVLSEYLTLQKEKNIVLQGLIAAIKINIMNPIFVESPGLTLASRRMNDPYEYNIGKKDVDYIYLDQYIDSFIKETLPSYLNSHPDIVMIMKSIWNRDCTM